MLFHTQRYYFFEQSNKNCYIPSFLTLFINKTKAVFVDDIKQWIFVVLFQSCTSFVICKEMPHMSYEEMWHVKKCRMWFGKNCENTAWEFPPLVLSPTGQFVSPYINAVYWINQRKFWRKPRKIIMGFTWRIKIFSKIFHCFDKKIFIKFWKVFWTRNCNSAGVNMPLQICMKVSSLKAGWLLC